MFRFGRKIQYVLLVGFKLVSGTQYITGQRVLIVEPEHWRLEGISRPLSGFTQIMGLSRLTC